MKYKRSQLYGLHKESEAFKWLKEQGYHGFGDVYTEKDKDAVNKLADAQRAKGYLVKILIIETRIGKRYSLWREKRD